MAFSVRITGWGDGGAGPSFEMEPPWWPADALREDPRFRATVSDGYLDYDALLSTEEARELHARFKSRATAGVYAWNDWQAIIRPLIAELDAALDPQADQHAYFHVRVFEWESGLG
jgi:hypothetical protein